MTSRAMACAAESAIGATPFPPATTISGSGPAAVVASSESGRAGIPAAKTSAPNTSAPTSAAPAAAGRGNAQNGRRTSCARRAAPTSSTSPRAAQRIASDARIATFVANSVVCGAIRSVARSPTPIAYARRPVLLAGVVFGSVIMKKRKTRISGEETRSHQNCAPSIGPTCQAAVIVCPLAARTPIPAANESQKQTAICSRCSRRRIRNPPTTIRTSATTSAGESGPHQSASGSARSAPSRRKQRTRPMFDGLKTWLPRTRMTYFDRSATADVPAKIHQPFMLHQSPCSVPGTRRTKATPFPVRRALAGHMITC